jgi:hypothetical protein
VRAALVSLLVYVGAVAWLTWPLATHLGTHLPATRGPWEYDAIYGLWVLAHDTRALGTDPANLANAGIFHPTPRALFYGPTALGALPAFAPTFIATGNPTLAMNLTFLGGLALTAWALHLVVLRWTGSSLAGMVAASTWLTSPYVLWYWMPTAPYHAVLFYLPAIVFLGATPLASVGSCVALAGLVAIQSLTDVIYVGPVVFLSLAVLALGRVVRRATRAAGLRLAAVLAIALVPLLPFLAEYAAVRAANPSLPRQTNWIGQLTMRFPLGLLHPGSPMGVAVSALALIVVGRLVRRRTTGSLAVAWRHAGVWASVGVLISLTRWVQIGEWTFTTPQFTLARWMGIGNPVRVPLRLGVGGLVGLCLLAGLAFAACAQHVREARGGRTWAALLAVALVAVMYGEYAFGLPPGIGRERMPATYRIGPTPVPPPRLLSLVAQRPGPLLQLPVGYDGVRPRVHARAMYYAIFHRRPILNGYSSYWPADFPVHMRMANRLPAPRPVAELRRRTGLALILVDVGWLQPHDRRKWLELAGKGRPDLSLLGREGDSLLFEVRDVDPLR